MTTDNLDDMLRSAFDTALDALDEFDLSDHVLRRLRRRQRLRVLVMSVSILIASAICVVSGLPLLGIFGTWLGELTSHANSSGQFAAVLGVIAAISFASLLPVLVDDTI